jgi:hypothetical protein
MRTLEDPRTHLPRRASQRQQERAVPSSPLVTPAGARRVRIEFTKALARWSEIRRAGWFIHENAPGVKAVLSDFPVAASINHPFAQYRA